MPRVDSAGADIGLYVVSCVKEKRATRAPARDLYTSPWFRKARAYVESTGRPWRILSARYGLVGPETTIRPYDKTLNGLPARERRAWADDVLATFDADLADADSVALLAGEAYREFLQPGLEARGVTVSVPMAGLRIGEQMAWLDEQVRRSETDEPPSGDLLS